MKPRRRDRDSAGGRASPTAFADWVFWQMNPGYRPLERGLSSLQMKWSGEYGHVQIEKLRFWLREDRRVGTVFENDDPWRTFYVDSPDKARQTTFVASRLQVDAQAVRGRPDVVLQNEHTGAVIVLERKVSERGDARIPACGYANHWCQLWCYGWMDAWINAPYVMLVLQY